MTNLEKLVLGVLTLYPGWTSREVADELDRSESAVSKAMLRLEERGLLDANNQPVKRRIGN